MVTPTRSPVKEPGPTVTATSSTASGCQPTVFNRVCTAGASEAALRVRESNSNSVNMLASLAAATLPMFSVVSRARIRMVDCCGVRFDYLHGST